jgi:hypothetical protein
MAKAKAEAPDIISRQITAHNTAASRTREIAKAASVIAERSASVARQIAANMKRAGSAKKREQLEEAYIQARDQQARAERAGGVARELLERQG